MLTQSLLSIVYRPAVHTLSDNETGTGRGGSQSPAHHITSHHIHNVSVFILSQPHSDSHHSPPGTDQNKQRFLFPIYIIPMVGHAPEATPGVILIVENIWIKN